MPEGRIQLILEQLERLPLILASTSQSAKLETSEHKVIVVNEESTDPGRYDGEIAVENSERDIKPDSPAYVIFTSGTTGRSFDAFLSSFTSERPHYTRCGLLRSL